ncbi:MAG: hypothetical protein D6797_01135 [Bdellovibrio sp.]|nr:MAG: hypothetical protein D6797_01135 [Bdellovibrio sp.]
MEEKLKEMTYGQAAIFGILLAAIYYFLAYDSGSSKELQLQNLTKQVQTKKLEIRKAKRAIASAKKFEKLAKQTGGLLEKVIQYLPNDMTPVEAKKMIAKEAQVVGISFSNISAKLLDEEVYDFVREIEIGARFKGEFNQMMNFLSDLTGIGKIIVVKKLQMSPITSLKSSSGPLIDMNLELRAFYFSTEEKKKDGGV